MTFRANLLTLLSAMALALSVLIRPSDVSFLPTLAVSSKKLDNTFEYLTANKGLEKSKARLMICREFWLNTSVLLRPIFWLASINEEKLVPLMTNSWIFLDFVKVGKISKEILLTFLLKLFTFFD